MASQDALLSLSNLSPRIDVYPYYYHMTLPGAENDCFLRKGTVEKLIKAANYLPQNLKLVIFDGWRSYETQFAIYEAIKAHLETRNLTKEKMQEEISKYVAIPTRDLNKPAPHLTGGAVDLTIADENGWLDMGTDFDDFTEKAQLEWYEKKHQLTRQEEAIRDNRRLLRKVMEGAGFVSNSEEWWHYDYGNRRWANATGNSIIYFGIQKN
ncbi:M15 family metallopeptidase [Fictibacillus terranigra]|uniref:D-alanyl-D-alanine dipeptidase n=1 Tax=Fictibacillus terranigra TaxID=3058424 RepID=A0ABT8E1S5_9BACL|nr:M15 family metallopeptidase [Fictibacillus sp. CENA-BCM004]MDN4071848.1 M15 family metallopeptidase [Fictibacillus sp. CENA-BCM004]